MKTKIFLSLFAIFASFSLASAQQLGYALTLNTDSNNSYQSGLYQRNTSLFPDNSHSWKHLFVIRHSNTNGNYQLQLGSSYAENDKMFFRKIISDTNISKNNTWHEIATRGENIFTGNQYIKSDLSIGDNVYLEPDKRLTLSYWGDRNTPGALHGFIYYPDQFWIRPHDIAQNIDGIHFNKNAEVGIGTWAHPGVKLSVNGIIEAKEIKVTLAGWPDFVFAKDYKLPTLTEVKAHIDEHSHLPGIPSEAEVKDNGVGLADMATKLLQKVEELTLYAIQQEERAAQQQKTIEDLKKEIEILKMNK